MPINTPMKKTISSLLILGLVSPLSLFAQTDGTMMAVPTSAPVPTLYTAEGTSADVAMPTAPAPTDAQTTGLPTGKREPAPRNTEGSQPAIKKVMQANQRETMQTTVAPRDAASGQATGKALAPRDAASGQATGKRLLGGSSTTEDMMKVKEKANRAMEQRASSSLAGTRGFCTEIEKTLSYIDTKAVKIDDKKQAVQGKVDTNRAENRADVDKTRTENRAKRENQFAELRKRAITDAQKQAVEAFIKSMEQALTVKNTAMDAILAKHRATVDKVTTSRRADTEKAIATLKSSVEAAKAKAKADCAAGTSGEVARTSLKASMDAAMQTFRTTVSSIEKVKDVTQADKDARKAEIDAIEATFKKSVDQARMDLKNALRPIAASSTTNQ